MVPCKSTAEEVSFEWSHNRILLTDSKIKTTLHVSITDSWSERIHKRKKKPFVLSSELPREMLASRVTFKFLYSVAIVFKCTVQRDIVT